MQNDPLVEWQRLTENYSKMYDDELIELSADSANLTEQARQVLGNEIRKRSLDAPRAGHMPGKLPDPMIERAAVALGVDPGAPDLVPDGSETNEDGDGPPEYTWKTLLCECDQSEEAWQISEALRQAGIESWIERPGSRQAVVWDERMVGNLRITVPADRLEEAREIIARPIPKEIVEQSRMTVPEFELPVCPKCGAGDPVLEEVDPVNSWLCEACGNQWTEPEADVRDTPEKAES
jgi:hypothetical protein